jgi:aerobic carbon-monoxide dehydrogenase medium subunit
MFPAQFECHRAGSVKDVLALIKQFGEDAKLLSGGHSLLPMMKLRLLQPAHLIDIGRIVELRQITEQGGKVMIGATCTHDQISRSELIRGNIGLIAECAAAIGDVQVRNRGTIGGSLWHADPAADYPAGVLAVEAELRLESEAGARTLKAEDFFVDIMTTAARPDEILTQVSFAPFPANAGYTYLKHRQPASGFAMVGVAALVTLDRRGNMDRVRVGITGLAAKAFRAKAVENAVAGKAPDADTISTAAAHAADGIDALSDIHAAADFRTALACVYTRRAIEAAVSRARNNQPVF